MKPTAIQPARIGILMLSIVTLASCDAPNTLPPIVEDLAKKQAAQQESLTKQSRELSEASRLLVEFDAKARKELVEHQSNVQSHIETQREVVQQQRDSLEGERREIAERRHRDPLIAAGLVQAATLLVAALPILVLILLIRAAQNEPVDVPLGELLTHELVTERPLLLPGPAFVATRPAVAISDDDESSPLIDGPPADG